MSWDLFTQSLPLGSSQSGADWVMPVWHEQVTPDEDVYNIYQDSSDVMQTKLLGTLSDLETVPVESVAGIPFKYAVT